jgi:UDP-N-acetylmuramyl pentapeptide phosphotransferase/UDP-N-acetylglucosamine-1-phosphate transferase
MDSIQEIVYSLPFLTVTSAILAYVMATRFNLYPVIIYVSKTKNLMDEPEERRVHNEKVPNLGGMGLFITFSLTLLLFVPFINSTVSDLSNLLSLLSATIILLFLGIKDDLVLMTAKKKFVIQLIAVSMVCLLQDVRITDFHGLLGVGELPYFVSILFTVFVFVLVINSVNLIDGIDGLAATISILASLAFGTAFFMADDFMMTLLSAVLIGSLLGFLKYNFSEDSKIFMGDCGSLIVGFLLAYQGIKFLNINPENVQFYNSNNSAILLLAILSYPLFDLLRVFVVRMMQKKNPFLADSNHIHHRLLRLGLNHKQATFLLFVSNLTLIIITFFTSDLQINISLIVVVCFGCLLYLLPFLGVFEEFEEKEIVADGSNKKQNIFSNNNLNSKVFSSENEVEENVIRLINLENSNGDVSLFETQNKNLTSKRVQEIKTWSSKKKSNISGNVSKI